MKELYNQILLDWHQILQHDKIQSDNQILIISYEIFLPWMGQNGPKMVKAPYFLMQRTQDAEFSCYPAVCNHTKFINNVFHTFKLLVRENCGPGWAKMVQKWPKMGKITIFQKLEDLGSLFWLVFPHLPPHRVQL